jgi:hypothetical protein
MENVGRVLLSDLASLVLATLRRKIKYRHGVNLAEAHEAL